MVAACRDRRVRCSITVPRHPQRRGLIEAKPEADRTHIVYWMTGGADLVETVYTAFASKTNAVPVRSSSGACNPREALN